MDPRTILNTLKEASPFDIFLISFLLLPFVADGWLGVMDKLDLSDPSRYVGLGIMLLVYILGIAVMLIGSSRASRRELAKDQIIQYLISKDFEMMSFERVRKNINSAYSDRFLEALPSYFSTEVRQARLKGGKPGIARIIETDAEEEV